MARIRRWRYVIAAVLLTVGVGAAAWLLWPRGGEPAAERDAKRAELVHCLAPAQRQALIDAAVALELVQRADQGLLNVRPGPEGPGLGKVTVEKWRQERKAGFTEACSALAGATRLAGGAPAGGGPGPSLLQTTLVGLVPVLAGAVLAWLAGELRARGANAAQAGQSLHTVATAFERACEAYLTAASRSPLRRPVPDDVVRERRADLLAELRRCAGQHARWEAPGALDRELATLDARMLDVSWLGLKTEERRAAIAALRGWLHEYVARVTELRRAVESPFLSHPGTCDPGPIPFDPSPARALPESE